MNIIIVEDEGITALFLKESVLDFDHSIVGIFDNALSLFEFLQETDQYVDLIFMDININGQLDGLQTAQKVYISYPTISFVFITSFKDSNTIKEAQIVKPLGYLVKPISETDLEAILMVVEANKENLNTEILENKQEIFFHQYVYNIEFKTLHYNDTLISLSFHEQVCLETLIKNKNLHVSTIQLITNIWDSHEENKMSSLRELIFRLRKKLPSLEIISTPNIGYLLKVSSD